VAEEEGVKKGHLLPIASDGWRFILPFGVLGVFLLTLGALWSDLLGTLGVAMALFCTYFFRDPNRVTPQDSAAIYSPGDGKVMEVGLQPSGDQKGWHIIRIFLSVLDGHVQRSPVKGRVAEVKYKEGLFLDARHLSAHIDNEQNTVTLVTDRGTILVKQIAGLIARRIVCWVKEGDALEQGERYGLIRFGSQVDVLMPPSTEVTISEGDRVVGGRTVIGKWKN
jgi:phosphatidylserine decarboxylase